MTFSKNGNRLEASVYKGLFTWRWFMYMVYSETFILANTFDMYRGFYLAPRWSQLHQNNTRFLLFCTSHFLMIRWATLGSYWPRELSWALNSFVLFDVPRGNFTVDKIVHTQKGCFPMGNSRLPMGKMSSVTAKKTRLNRWIHTKKHRNTSKIRLLSLFNRKISKHNDI